jgi:major vault protein
MDRLGKKDTSESKSIYRIPPYYYLHVLDQNTNVTMVKLGPQTFIRQDNEKVIIGPEKMIVVPPRHYCIIENPVMRDKDSKPILDVNGQIRLRHADQEIRLAQEPFPLYPGELLKQIVTQLKVVQANSALRLRAVLDFESEDTKRVAGDEWLFEGPGNIPYTLHIQYYYYISIPFIHITMLYRSCDSQLLGIYCACHYVS